jgi:peptidoglycan/xylan/chitin deacetylase (PgdA/CDA1 family)
MPPTSWPGGKRVAVLVSVLLENWTDGKWPSYFTRTTPIRAGLVDHAGIEWSHFGGREGIWRILRLLERSGRKATVFTSGRAGELYPDAVRAVAAAGHDVAAHGYAQDVFYSELSREQQQASIRQCCDILEQLAGRRPSGWASPVYSWNEETFDILAREGFSWYADALDISLPRLRKTASGNLVALPWSDFVDNRVLRASPRDFFDVYKETFDYLDRAEPLGLLHIAVHSHFGGRPMMAAMFEKTLAYFQNAGSVWFPRHAELVQWFLDQKTEDMAYRKRFFD